MFNVARDGEIIGEFTEAQFARMIRSLEIRSTDHYFVEGMAEWEPVYEYRPSVTLPPTPTPESVRTAQAPSPPPAPESFATRMMKRLTRRSP